MTHRAVPLSLAVILTAGLTGCVAPDIVRQGAVGLTVDEQHRPVLLVEPCGSPAVEVTMSGTREGLGPEETNREEGGWTATDPPTELTELALHRPGPAWAGPAFTPRPGLGYVAGARGTTRGGVLTQVSFRTDDLAGLQLGTVYIGPDPETDEHRELTREAFSAWACSRD